MAKFYGEIGFSDTVENAPGVWEVVITERVYSGDVLRSSKRWTTEDKVNNDLVINNEISIIADAYAYDFLHAMKYVKFLGKLWEISSIEIMRPRIKISMGGVYNGV